MTFSTIRLFLLIALITLTDMMHVESFDSDTQQQRQSQEDRVGVGVVSCKSLEACAMCTSRDKKNFEVCEETGCKQKFECYETVDSEDSETSIEFRSCKRTEEEEVNEEFEMVR